MENKVIFKIFFFIIIILILIYFNNLIKFMMITELFFCFIILEINFLMNLNIFSFSVLIISMMIMESSLSIILIFEFLLMKKFLYFNNLNLF